MEKNKSEPNLLSLGNDHCSIKDEDSTRNEEYVEEENSMSEHLSSIDNMTINEKQEDQNEPNNTEEFIQCELAIKEETVTHTDQAYGESVNDKTQNEELKPRRFEKALPTTEPTRRSKRRINAPLRDSPPRSSSLISLAMENSIEKSKSSSSLTSKSIREGDEFQASVLAVEEWQGPSTSIARSDEDRDECLWKPDDGLLDPRELDEFCQTLQRHCDADIPEAMNLLHKCGYDRLKALEASDELALSQSSDWSQEEIEIFYNSFSKPGKNFRRVLKELPGKKMSDLVEFYYRVKKARCFTSSNFSFCEKLGSITTDDAPIATRDLCENCTKALWQTEGKMEIKNRRRVKLCSACELYFKISKCYRPCKQVAPINNDSLELGITPNSVNSFSKMISIIPKDHPDCFFEPRLEKLRETIEWSSDETLECVQGFHKFGKDFEKIAEQIDGKTPEMISEFYELHKARYRLDFLISLYEREQVGETYARNSRNINACDDDDEFDGDSRARESRSNTQRRDFSKSSMITRNQKKRTVDVEY